MSGAKRRKFFLSCPSLFGFTSTISRFGERFYDGQYSLVGFLFAVLLLTVPRCPAMCKSRGGGTFSPCLTESASLIVFILSSSSAAAAVAAFSLLYVSVMYDNGLC